MEKEGEVSIKLEMKVEEVNLILQALDEMPHKMVRGLVDKISEEGQKQIDSLSSDNETTEGE